MATPNLQIQGGNFQDAEGNVLNAGYLLFQLSHDESYASGPSQIVAGLKFRVTLNSTGSVPSSPATMIYSNDTLLPSGSFYIIRAFKADGTEAWASPQYASFSSSPNPYDLGNIVPTNPPGTGLSGSGASTLLLETNGSANSNQALLNLTGGTNVTVSNSAGTTTISATGGPTFSGSGAFMFGPGIRGIEDVLSSTWGAPLANSVNGTKTANQVTVYLFQLDVAMTIRKVSVTCTNNVIGPTASFGIYSFAGSKLVDGGSFTTLSSPTVQTNTITPVTIQPGTYWHAQACSTNTTAATFSGLVLTSGAGSQSIPIYVANATRSGTAANAMSGGVLPATLGAITGFTPIAADGDGPCCPLYE